MENQEKLRNALRSWFSAFVSEFRKGLEKVPDEKKPSVIQGNDFRAPSRIFVFWLLNPQFLDVIVVRDPKLPSDAVKIYGPALLSEITSYAEMMLKDSWFDDVSEPTRSQLESYYKKIVEDILLAVATNLPQIAGSFPLLPRNQINVVKRAGIGATYFTWTIFGNLLGQDPAEFVTTTIGGVLERLEKEQMREKNSEKTGLPPSIPVAPTQSPTRQGFLSAFYPPIWIGEPLAYGFREKVAGIYIPPSSKSLRVNYKERELTIMRNGVLTLIEPVRSTCLELLNEIMCTALLLGVPSTSIREMNLAEASFYGNGNLESYSLNISERTRRSVEMEWSPISQEEFSTFKVISEADLKQLLETSARSTLEPAQSNFAMWFIDSVSYCKEANFDQSITKSWLVIEKYLRDLWQQSGEKTMKKKNRSTTIFPTMDRVLKDLLKSGKITENEHEILDKMRNERNRLLHDGYTSSKESAESFVSFAERLTRQKLDISGLSLKDTSQHEM